MFNFFLFFPSLFCIWYSPTSTFEIRSWFGLLYRCWDSRCLNTEVPCMLRSPSTLLPPHIPFALITYTTYLKYLRSLLPQTLILLPSSPPNRWGADTYWVRGYASVLCWRREKKGRWAFRGLIFHTRKWRAVACSTPCKDDMIQPGTRMSSEGFVLARIFWKWAPRALRDALTLRRKGSHMITFGLNIYQRGSHTTRGTSRSDIFSLGRLRLRSLHQPMWGILARHDQLWYCYFNLAQHRFPQIHDDNEPSHQQCSSKYNEWGLLSSWYWLTSVYVYQSSLLAVCWGGLS